MKGDHRIRSLPGAEEEGDCQATAHSPPPSGESPARPDSAARFQALVSGGLDAFFVFTSVRDERGRIADFELFDLNTRGEELLGRTRDQLVSSRLREILPAFPPGFHEKCLRVAVSGEMLEEEVALTSSGPQASWLQLQVVRMGDGVGVALRDISERKRLERQLLHSQKMEAVGRLAGGVAHDFNNLLTTILGYSELMLMKLPESSPVRADVEEILKAGQRAVGLTRQLLAFSRKQVIEPKVVNLNAVIEEAAKMLRRLIGEDVDLATSLDPSLGSVRVDPGQIEQVLMNLAVNSRDAMPRGGRLTLETRNVTFDASASRLHFGAPPGAYVLLAVTDTGMGMDAETRSHLFEPFYTTKEKGTGTGLGLATVYGIVKQSDGYIFVYSEPGKGTTFKIYLPRVEAAGTDSAAAVPASAVANGKETLLLVEDEEPVRRLMHRSLMERGYSVLEAPSGEAALTVATSHPGPIDLLITDVVLTGVSGKSLATLLLTSRPTLKLLFISGYTDDTVVRHGVLAKDEAFLQKPFTPDALARRVREVLDARKAGGGA